MKSTVIVLGFAMSSVVSAASILNGVKLSNLPTASKSYSRTALTMSDAAAIKTNMESECAADKAATEALLGKSSAILTSTGCVVRVVDNSYCDQGGCGEGIVVSTSFEVVFK